MIRRIGEAEPLPALIRNALAACAQNNHGIQQLVSHKMKSVENAEIP